MPPKESATSGLHLKGVPGIIRNTNVAYLVAALYLVMEESIDGCHNQNPQRRGEHRGDKKPRRPPPPTCAGVAPPRERGRFWPLVPRKTGGRFYGGRARRGRVRHTGLRACDAGNA